MISGAERPPWSFRFGMALVTMTPNSAHSKAMVLVLEVAKFEIVGDAVYLLTLLDSYVPQFLTVRQDGPIKELVPWTDYGMYHIYM